MLQSLLLSALLPASILATPLVARTYTDDCGAGSFTVSGRTCTISCNLDYAGGDYKSAPAATVQDCLSLCAADSLCTDAQFNRDNKYCYMKNKLTRTSWSHNTDSVVCDATPDGDGPSDGGPGPTTPASCPAEKTVNGRTCTATCSYDRAGGDYDMMYTGTAALCMDACMRDTRCKTAQFNKGNGYCYLKNKLNQGTDSTTTDTIDCTGPKLDCSAASHSGLTYKVVSHSISGYGDTLHQFTADMVKGKSAVTSGSSFASSLSFPTDGSGNWPVIGVSSYLTGLIFQGIFIAPQAGKYTISSDNYLVDNWAYVWTGDKAYSEWCEGNQDYSAVGPTQYTYEPQKIESTSFTLAAGEGIPITLLIANGGGPGKSQFTLTMPDGTSTDNFASMCAPTCSHAQTFST